MNDLFNLIRERCRHTLSTENVEFVPDHFPPENIPVGAELAWATLDCLDSEPESTATLFGAAEYLAGEVVHHGAETSATSHAGQCAQIFIDLADLIKAKVRTVQ